LVATVVEAEPEDAIDRLPLELLHELNENGPLGEDEIDGVLPESYHPSPVGLGPIDRPKEPDRVVVSVQVALLPPLSVFPDGEPHPAEEKDSPEGQVADHEVEVEPLGKMYPTPP